MKCPTCGKAVEWQGNAWRPFCSERCKLIDFGHWADEDYRIPDETTRPDAAGEDPDGESVSPLARDANERGRAN